MKKLILPVFCLFLSCTPLELIEVGTDVVKSFEKCDLTTYQTEFQQKGIYRDEKGRSYEVLVDFQDVDDAWSFQQTAKDVAELSSITINTLEKNNFKSTNHLYISEFSKIHIIVTSTQEEFIYLLGNEKESVVAFVNVDQFCWDFEDANFTIVIKNSHFQNIQTLVHEFGHVISYYEWGSTDGNHNDPRIWYELNGVDSIAGKILVQYEYETGLNVIDEGPVD